MDNTKSYSSQMSQASKDMWNVIKDDPVAQSKFTSKQLKALEAVRARVPGYTWHHNAQSSPNNMQLVPDSIHSNKTVPHTGQNSLTNSDK
ncbi:HNH endonuclease [uncultured Acinetobacter sp.]|uniref:HNH endonuclease n=1 Tax=uncultured Acinetobacter sp. TaxID=165433 RepID=UPI00258DE919|nr:HNH endonuclease [uncultured Acinetobacter sp.]